LAAQGRPRPARLPPHGATIRDKKGQEGFPRAFDRADVSRFFALISLFAFAMLVLVVSDNLLTLYIGWEIMGFCSYALIGFWYAEAFGARRGRESLHDHPHRRCVHAAGYGGALQRHRQPELPRYLAQKKR
jgi:hypothetical protein